MVINSQHHQAFAALRLASPRVQCLTNTVAQALTANVLHAIGARVSMTTHSDEVAAMTASADAVLINLGTLDDARVAAIPQLLDSGALAGKTLVLDPVFAQHSPVRLALALRVLQHPHLIVKGNSDEITVLRGASERQDVLWITTGETDRIEHRSLSYTVAGGHRWMGTVTGMGCALGATLAAYAAIIPDRMQASVAAVRLFADAGTRAAETSRGPGSFAVAFLDALERLTLESDQQ
jgi:hydroxyethylthiazole kinase